MKNKPVTDQSLKDYSKKSFSDIIKGLQKNFLAKIQPMLQQRK